MATIIKSTTAAQGVQRVAFNFEDMAERAGIYLAEVRAQAAQIVAEAQQQADSVRQQAEQEGQQSAMQAAERAVDEKIQQRLQTLLPALEQVIANMADAKQVWLSHWETRAVRLAAAIAAKITRREAKQMPEVTVALVRESLEMAAGSSQIRVHLHPADCESLKAPIERLTRDLHPGGQAQILSDPAITPGGCRVETLHGVIDQQFESQIARIEEELVGGNDE